MTLPATREDGVTAFLNAHGGPVGEFVRFTKEAKFARVSDGEEIKPGTRCICVFDQTQHGGSNSMVTGSRQPGTWAQCSAGMYRRHVASLAMTIKVNGRSAYPGNLRTRGGRKFCCR